MEIKTLGTVATYINGRAFKPDEWETSGRPIIRIQNLTDSSAKFNYSSVEHDKRFLVKNGDLLFAWSASLGAHIWKGGDAWLNQHIFKVIPNDGVHRDYLYYYLLNVVSALYSKTHGSGMVHITKGPFMATKIPVPSLPEQERIVAKIEELFSELDSGVETLKKTKQQLAVYRQSVLKDAFEGKLSGSKTTSRQTLAEFIEKPRYGTSKKCDYTVLDKAIPVYRIPNIDYKVGHIDHDDIKSALFTPQELDGITLCKDDILIIRSNGSVSLVGRAAIVNDIDTNGTFAGYLMRLRIKNHHDLIPRFLLWYLQSHSARIYIENKAKSTSGVHNINSTEISNLHIPVFPYQDQLAIIQAIESRMSVVDSIEQTIDAALQQADALRQSILKKAFEEEL